MAQFRFLFIVLFLSSLVHAQERLDTLLVLPDVHVTQSKWQKHSVGAKIESIDSLSRSTFAQNSLSELLSAQSQIYIKNYGPGQLSSTSIRGGSAQHTPVLWKGINLQNPMLGQVDLSLFPVALFDDIQLQYGGNAALWGSGAIGGAIHLANKNAYDRPMFTQFQTTIGSFENFNQGLNVIWGNKQVSTALKGYFKSAKNNFSYTDNSGQKAKIEHNALSSYGFLTENSFRLSPNQELSLSVWWNHSKRQLPITLGQNFSDSKQEDDALRIVGDWKYVANDWVLNTKAAFVKERYLFESESSRLHTDATSRNVLLEANAVRSFNQYHSFTIGLNQQVLNVSSEAYNEEASQYRTAAFTAWTMDYQKWNANVSLRQVIYESKLAPFVPSIGLAYHLTENATLMTSISRVFRIPTFNELYWDTGDAKGNEDLLAEEGWNQSLGLNHKWLNNNSKKLSFSHTIYNKQISNWILWESHNGIIQAQNLAEVWSRGFEEKVEFHGKTGDLVYKLTCNYDFTLATNQVAKRVNDNSVGKQLIYVPKHKAIASLLLKWDERYFQAFQQFNSTSYTSPDNQESLPSLFLSSVAFGQRFKISNHWLKFQLRINNLFNKNYQVIAGRPMPGINYEFSITFQFINK